MNWPTTIANSLWIGTSLPVWSSFRSALNRPAEVQQNLLRDLLARNADCAYGRAHGFHEIKTYEEFTRRIPMSDYEEFEPWIERIRRGEPQVLTRETVTHLIPTSGSTGARKLVPFTAGLQREFDRAIGPWLVDLVRQNFSTLCGPAYWSITPAQPLAEARPSVVPIGFADDSHYLGGVKGWLVRATMVTPGELGGILDLDEFRFRTLLCLLRERDLRLISVWHPSFLALLLDALPEQWATLLAELRRKNGNRARELEQADPRQPESLWPKLRVISAWGDGHAQLPIADLQRRFPNVLVQFKGLLATEAFVTIPFGAGHPVSVRSHFFEFLDEQGRVRRVHELAADQTCEVIVTTAGGLWRYRMHDQVQVVGFVGKTPSLRFLGRSGNVSDRFGEKLSEAFVATAIQQTLAAFEAKPRFVLLAPEEDPAGWHYTLYFEGSLPAQAATTLDDVLRRNPHYACCRDVGQLQPPRLFAIAKNGFEKFAARLAAQGKRLGDIKPSPLSTLAGWSSVFFDGEPQTTPMTNKSRGHMI